MVHMNQMMLAIAAIVTAAALNRNILNNTIGSHAGDGDESETSTHQHVKQKNTGSGDSANFNCGENLIKAGVDDQECEFED
jgi:hypothetical protein